MDPFLKEQINNQANLVLNKGHHKIITNKYMKPLHYEYIQ